MPDHAYPCPPTPSIILHGRRLRLSETQARLLSVLLARPQQVIADAEFLQLLPGTTLTRLNRRMTQLHATVVPHGLEIHRGKQYGFVLVLAKAWEEER